jgi:DNA-binding NtrC family response regulator
MSKKEPHLLLIDDDLDLADIFRESLMDLSFKVTVAYNAQDALELFKKNTYDGVISDVMMPQMSGVELIGHIRQLNADLPVYFITGYLDYSRESLNSLKPRAIIFKPFDVEEAAMLIKNHFLKEF